MPHEAAVEMIVEGKGSHFDPDVVDAFVAIEQEFRAIAQQFSDLKS
jgi:putative two-component system response regulator